MDGHQAQQYRQVFVKVGTEGSLEEVREAYDLNANNYDEYSAFTGRDAGALALAKVIETKHPNKETTRILDIAAGTGVLGIQLKKLNFMEVDAFDVSQGMLDKAKSKGIYRNYICDSIRLNEKTQIDDDTYDVVCMMGGMAPGHITPDLLPEFTRITKCGGTIIFNISEKALKSYPGFQQSDLETKLQSFVKSEDWVEWTKVNAPFYSNTGETCKIYIGIVG